MLFPLSNSWPLPPQGGGSRISPAGNAVHQQSLPARRAGQVCPNAGGKDARRSVRLLLCQFRLGGERSGAEAGTPAHQTARGHHAGSVSAIYIEYVDFQRGLVYSKLPNWIFFFFDINLFKCNVI